MSRAIALPAAVVTLAFLGLTACSDDGGSTRSASASASGSGSGSASGSGTAGDASGSGSGISIAPDASTDDPQVQEAAAQYTQYVRGQVDQLLTDTKVFTDAVRDGDVEAAKAAFAPSRQAWERIEPIAGLVEDVDSSVDARVDDFESPDDPSWTGWHRLEYLLWEKGDIGPDSGAAKLADQLDADLARLKATIDATDIPAAAIPAGAAELIEEVSAGKITGEEDRYSGTDLWDFAANVAGSKEAFELLEPAIRAKDPDLAANIAQGFTDVEAQLSAYAEGDGYQPFSVLSPEDADKMKSTLAQLSENLALVSGVLGLG